MTRWVPVLGQYRMREPVAEPVDGRHDRVAAWHGQRPARAEIVLHIDDQQHVTMASPAGLRHLGFLANLCRDSRADYRLHLPAMLSVGRKRCSLGTAI